MEIPKAQSPLENTAEGTLLQLKVFKHAGGKGGNN